METAAGQTRTKEALIGSALDWAKQRADFQPDGSLCDIYVQQTTEADWRGVLALIFEGTRGVRLIRGDEVIEWPVEMASIFAAPGQWSLSFTVGGVTVQSAFFGPDEIELWFDPKQVTASALHDLLAFLIDIGDATNKPSLLTPENLARSPIFRYDPGPRELRWHAPPPQPTTFERLIQSARALLRGRKK